MLLFNKWTSSKTFLKIDDIILFETLQNKANFVINRGVLLYIMYTTLYTTQYAIAVIIIVILELVAAILAFVYRDDIVS